MTNILKTKNPSPNFILTYNMCLKIYTEKVFKLI